MPAADAWRQLSRLPDCSSGEARAEPEAVGLFMDALGGGEVVDRHPEGFTTISWTARTTTLGLLSD